jgi:hypothetical protein
MFQIFQNELDGYQFLYNNNVVGLTNGSIYINGIDVLQKVNTLQEIADEFTNTNVITGLKYQNNKYEMLYGNKQLMALPSFKYFDPETDKQMYLYQAGENDYRLICWLVPLSPISVSFGVFTNTISKPQWTVLRYNSDPRDIPDDVNQNSQITITGFLGNKTLRWGDYKYPDSPLVNFIVI